MKELAKRCKEASKTLMSLDLETKNKIFDELVLNLKSKKHDIINANQLDVFKAEQSNLSNAMVDRLRLTRERIDQMINGVIEIKNQKEVVGSFFDEFVNPNGLSIKRQRVPIGVILMIFESRPNVVIDCAALALKSSNGIILKGGKEAKETNEILGKIITESINKYIPEDSVITLASDDRNAVSDLLECNESIDVVVPRGGHGLIEYVYDHAKMPVIAHYKGLCHMYIDKYADIEKGLKLVENAKTQRTGVCNAIETLLVHSEIMEDFAPKLSNLLTEKGTELRVDKEYLDKVDFKHQIATSKDWETEYLENILSVKTVHSFDEAIDHISKYGSHHSECIVSEDKERCQNFINRVNASCVMVNASTRFNDGGQLGLGAELGISTSKLHAYGPMGVEQMTTSRFVVMGEGQIRS